MTESSYHRLSYNDRGRDAGSGERGHGYKRLLPNESIVRAQFEALLDMRDEGVETGILCQTFGVTRGGLHQLEMKALAWRDWRQGDRRYGAQVRQYLGGDATGTGLAVVDGPKRAHRKLHVIDPADVLSDREKAERAEARIRQEMAAWRAKRDGAEPPPRPGRVVWRWPHDRLSVAEKAVIHRVVREGWGSDGVMELTPRRDRRLYCVRCYQRYIRLRLAMLERGAR